MFIGEFTHNLDEKGRVAIPVKFRADLEMGAILTRGLDGCLFLYTRTEWMKLMDKIVNLPLGQAGSRAFSRHMLSGAAEVLCDTQGRIIIPDYLEKFAEFKKKVVIIGVYNRIEIWSEEKWRKFQEINEKDCNIIAEQLTPLGI